MSKQSVPRLESHSHIRYNWEQYIWRNIQFPNFMKFLLCIYKYIYMYDYAYFMFWNVFVFRFLKTFLSDKFSYYVFLFVPVWCYDKIYKLIRFDKIDTNKLLFILSCEHVPYFYCLFYCIYLQFVNECICPSFKHFIFLLWFKTFQIYLKYCSIVFRPVEFCNNWSIW